MLCLIASFHTLVTRNVIQTISNFLLWGSFIVSLRLCHLNQAKFKSQGGFVQSQCLLENREDDKKIEAGKGVKCTHIHSYPEFFMAVDKTEDKIRTGVSGNQKHSCQVHTCLKRLFLGTGLDGSTMGLGKIDRRLNRLIFFSAISMRIKTRHWSN